MIADLARDQKIKIPTLPLHTSSAIFGVKFTQLNQCRYIDVLIKKMFSSITERKSILKSKALIHVFRTCCLRIFALRDPFLPQEQRI